jgi:hypothetical protein
MAHLGDSPCKKAVWQMGKKNDCRCEHKSGYNLYFRLLLSTILPFLAMSSLWTQGRQMFYIILKLGIMKEDNEILQT